MTLLEWLDLSAKRRPKHWCPLHAGIHLECGDPCVVVEVGTVDTVEGVMPLSLTPRNEIGRAYAIGQRDGAALHNHISRPNG